MLKPVRYVIVKMHLPEGLMPACFNISREMETVGILMLKPVRYVMLL